MKSFKQLWYCQLLGSHDWTCAAKEGIPPTQEQLQGGLVGFWEYAKMYCRRCPKVYDESLKQLNQAKSEKPNG